MANRTNPSWAYEAVCFRCRDSYVGSQAEVSRWLRTSRCAGGHSPNDVHDGLPLAVHLPDVVAYRSRLAADVLVEAGAGAGVTRSLRLSAASDPPCDHLITRHVHDFYGRFNSHARRRFFLRGEDWTCCLPTSSYRYVDRHDVTPCGKRGTSHVVMPRGLVLPLSADDGCCGIVCDWHGAELRADGARTSRL